METPGSVTSDFDDPRIRLAREKLRSELSEKARALHFPKFEGWKERQEFQENYDKLAAAKSVRLVPGNFVYADYKLDLLSKSYDWQRGRLYIIDQINTSRKRPLYKLRGLMNETIPGT